MNDIEIWKDAAGYEEFYQVSNFGRVKSKDRVIEFLRNSKTEHRQIKSKFLKQREDKDGYLTVGLQRIYDKSKNTTVRVHRLVLDTFIGNAKDLPFVNHKDENKQNNYLSNLEYCTEKYNVNYGTCIERRANSKKIPILQCELDGTPIKEWRSAKDASIELHIDNSSISACVRGKLNSFHGYKWVRK